jgi:apolipoprotein D and lipocalin family protein
MTRSGKVKSLIAAFTTAILLMASQAALAEPKVASVNRHHYTGTWLEIARRPMFITDGCVAGFTTYKPGPKPDQIDVLDGCYEGTPNGKQKTVSGRGTLQDAGSTNARLTVRYPLFITFHYWVLYEAPNHSWFISADPDMKNLWIYTRKVPSKKQLAVMVKKASALGYDVSKLEFPPAR